MRNASQYARRIRRLLATLRGSAPRVAAAGDGDVSDAIVPAVLRRYASDAAAAAAYRRLCAATVDLNDLRVTAAPEIAEVLGPEFPDAAAAAESIIRVLGAVFNRCHHLDLSFLKNMGRREAREYVESLDGMSRFSAALLCLRALGQHAVPLDERGLEWLRQHDLVEPQATEIEVQAFLERVIPPGQVEVFLAGLRRSPASPKPAGSSRRAGAKRLARAKRARSSRAAKARRPAAQRPRPRSASKRRAPRPASRRR